MTAAVKPLRNKFVSIRLTGPEHRAVKVRAARHNVTMARYLQLALVYYDRHAPKK